MKKHVSQFKNGYIWKWKEKSDISHDGILLNETISIEGNHIINLNDDSILNSDIYDISDHVVLPGLADAHIHVSLLGESRYFIDLSECYSISDLIVIVSNHIDKHPDLEWIQGINWDQTKLGCYPSWKDLDMASLTKPILLWRSCWHIIVVNSAAMNNAGFDKNQISFTMEGGTIDIDDNHEITGIFRENAIKIITSTLQKSKSIEQKKKFLKDGLEICLKSGITSVQTNDELCYHAYQELQKEDDISIRVFFTPCIQDLHIDTNMGGIKNIEPIRSSNLRTISPIDANSNTISDWKQDSLTMERVKLFSDGSLGAETAALRLSIDDKKPSIYNHSGVLIYSYDNLIADIELATKNGYRVEIHAIGDAAVEQVLNAIEYCNTKLGKPLDRPILTHCQVLGIDLIPRISSLGVIANIQPSFVPTDMRWVQQRLNFDKQLYSYAWKTLLNNNIHVAGGSDAPVENCSPFLGIHDAMYRCARKDASQQKHSSVYSDDILLEYNYDPSQVFRLEETLTFSEALYLYTTGAAYASHTEDYLGSLDEGYLADFVVIEKSFLDNPRSLSKASPAIIVINGKIVYFSSDKIKRIKALNHISSSSSSRDVNNSDDTKEVMEESVYKKSKYESSSHGYTLSGPFIPGKNGRFSCACILLGKLCQETMRES